jgi:hypothetical protein
MKKLSLAIAGATCFALSGVGTAQASTIDTTPTWNGTQFIDAMGEPNTATYGQTFTVGSDNVLNDFTFWLDDRDPAPVDFAGYLMAWDGVKATGNILYQSGKRSTAGNAGMEPFTFNTGGTSLTSGQQYVAFLSASNFFDEIDSLANMGSLRSDVYAGGDFVYFNNSSSFSQLTTTNWDCTGGCFGDAAFVANFSSGSVQAVPEPSSSLGLLAFGGFVAGKVLKRKKALLTIESKDKE